MLSSIHDSKAALRYQRYPLSISRCYLHLFIDSFCSNIRRTKNESKAVAEKKETKELLEEYKRGIEAKLKLTQGYRKAMGMLNTSGAELDQCDEQIQTFLKQIAAVDAKLARLANERKEADEREALKWQSTEEAKVANAEPRLLSHLYGDIIASPTWITNGQADESSSATIQRLEKTQEGVETGLLPKTHEYANVTNYFMYSATRHCCVQLVKQSSNPPVWVYKHYYQCSPLPAVVEIFKSCKGREIPKLSADIKIDKDLFADVPQTPTTR